MAATPVAAEAVLAYWLPMGGELPGPSQVARWFQGGPAVDDEIRARFAALISAALAGGLGEWAVEPRGLLALVILLDQFTRNVYRGRLESFAGDQRALELARSAVDAGSDRSLHAIERYFLYLPFQHAEDPERQDRSLALYRSLLADAPAPGRALFADALDYARRHQRTIARFGRFPARNAALRLRSTSEEEAYLRETPGGF